MQEKPEVLTQEADEIIERLGRAVKYGMATDEEKASLEAREKYSVLVMRINPEDGLDIEWPPRPE